MCRSPWFKMRCVPLLLKKFLHTQNMFISDIEIFLHRRKVSKHTQKTLKDGNFWPDFGLILFRLQNIHSLRRCKKFSMPLMNMFWVYKSFSNSRGTQRILNQERTTHRKNGAFQAGQLWIFWNQDKIKPKSYQKFPSFGVFCGCLVTLRQCKRFSVALLNMFWVCKRLFRNRENTAHFESGIWHIEKKQLAHCGFFAIRTKSGQKFPSFNVFWGCLLTLRQSKKFSMRLMNMFWVCKIFYRSRGTQRILNQRLTKYKKKTTLFKVKIVSKMAQTYI